MDFTTVVLVLLIYFIRPQDWMPGLIGVGIVSPVMMAAIGSMIYRARENDKKIQLFRTPHDWAMMAYYIYAVYTSVDPSGTLKEAFSLFAFYFVTVQALNSTERLKIYLKAWMWAVFTLAAFGVMSIYGLDITGARPMTEAMLGRLALGTWMHNNPNALGHTVMTAIPLAYFFYYWKQSTPTKLIAIFIWVVCYLAIYETQSKGAVVSGFATLVLSYSFGRSKIVQILLLTAALAGGGAALSMMPRMEKMGDLRSDEGVQGRLLAWEQARIAVDNDFTGEGWKQFHAIIKWDKTWIPKATHSSYVKIGADLGYPGMFLYIGILWLGIRTLIRAKVEDHELDLCRRALFALIIAYIVSNWMIDRAYHTEYFLFMAAIAAFHRIALLDPATKIPTEAPEEAPSWQQARAATWMIHYDATATSEPKVAASLTRPTLIDCALAAGGTWTIFYLWSYILKNL